MNNSEQNITDAQMEAEFQERNKNLKQSLNHIVDKIDHAAQSTQDFLDTESNTTTSTTSTSGNTLMGGFKTGGMGTNTDSTGMNQTTAGFESKLDSKLMHSINDDIVAMHSTDPEVFEGVASKFDETFGSNALV